MIVPIGTYVQIPYTGVAVHRLNPSPLRVDYYQGAHLIAWQMIWCPHNLTFTVQPSGALIATVTK